MAFYTNRRLLNHLLPAPNNHPHYLLHNNNHWHYTEFDSKNFQIQNQPLFYLFILFSVILLITLILLYARWYFRFRHFQASASHLHHSRHPDAPHAPAKLTKGLNETVVKAIPIVLHQGNGIEMECCICIGVFEDGDKVKVLQECQHRFHSDCVDRWLFSQPTCPLCRVSLRAAPPASNNELELAQA